MPSTLEDMLAARELPEIRGRSGASAASNALRADEAPLKALADVMIAPEQAARVAAETFAPPVGVAPAGSDGADFACTGLEGIGDVAVTDGYANAAEDAEAVGVNAPAVGATVVGVSVAEALGTAVEAAVASEGESESP